ncbi:hypothetical protein F5884DRAFT_743498 [Xylogone sp. PMI_703]|nr:hypothetical protein F5884DRAFT_743498 [Xylogone sp. PMI_703]
MSQLIPKTTKAWTINPKDGDFSGLKLNNAVSIPPLSDNDVLVKFHAASLNYRDLVIAMASIKRYPVGTKDGVVPGSDGAGEVIAVGSKVTRFKTGDRVVTVFNPNHLAGNLSPKTRTTALGSILDGTLRQYGAFNENSLVEMPLTLTYEEASTLSCAAVTAWNSLYGLKPLLPGEAVLTQGTGGVSIFAAQFAKAAGATVIATTGSPQKVKALKKLGVDHIINYKEDSNWGETAKSLTPKEEGVAHVIEVGGPGTIAQSFKAVKMEGIISLIGFLDNTGEKQPSYLEPLSRNAIVRGIPVGSRLQLEELSRAIDSNKIKPAVDPKIFSLEQLPEAYQYMWEQKHFGKIVIKIE